jgi:hypothetical protein
MAQACAQIWGTGRFGWVPHTVGEGPPEHHGWPNRADRAAAGPLYQKFQLPARDLRCWRWFLAVFDGEAFLQAHWLLSLTPCFSGVNWGRVGPSTALAVSSWAKSGRDRWKTAKAVEMPAQPVSTPLKRGVNESEAGC